MKTCPSPRRPRRLPAFYTEVDMGKKPRRHYDIVEFEDRMLDQVADLNVQQYGGTVEEKKADFARIMSEPFARDKGVAICALDGDTVVGVQTYRYWPYERDGHRYYSLQSGGTLVHPEHRGQGLFMRMLRAGNDILAGKDVDFLTGFPVPMSFGGFMKDNWFHVDSPMWYLRVIRPVKLAAQRVMKTAVNGHRGVPEAPWIEIPGLRRVGVERRTNLVSDADFLRYRYGDGRSSGYLVKRWEWAGKTAIIIGRTRASNGFTEFIIGDVLTDDGSLATVYRAFGELVSELRRQGDIAACSMLVGTGALELYPVLARYGFLPTFKKASFITKPVSEHGSWVGDRWAWNLMHADIDTW